MNAPLGSLVLCTVLVVANATLAGATTSAGSDPSSADIRIEMNDGSLTLTTHDAPLHEVMREIGELAGFKTILVGDFIDPPLVNVLFDDIPVREAIERLVSDRNRIILYGLAGDDTQQRIISQVWLLQSGDASGDGIASDVESIALGREEDVKGRKLARLTRMLQEDQSALVRARAAIALGALRDERAVFALESALLDKNSSVRSQAINALGHIGGERATTVLGNILLYGSADKTERVMAAQALWKHDSEAARRYLLTGTYDTDEQVRLASSKAPTSPKARATNDQLDDAEAQ